MRPVGWTAGRQGWAGHEGDEFRVVVPYVRPVEHLEAALRRMWGLHFPALTNLDANGSMQGAQTLEIRPGYLRPGKAPPFSSQAFLGNPRLSHACAPEWAICWASLPSAGVLEHGHSGHHLQVAHLGRNSPQPPVVLSGVPQRC